MDFLQRELNALDAESKLLELDQWENVAKLSETDPVSYLRSSHANFYRDWFGFLPDVRHQVRQRLERLQQTGACSVGELLQPYQSMGLGDEVGIGDNEIGVET